MVARFRPDVKRDRKDNVIVALPWQNAVADICRRCRFVMVFTASPEHAGSRLAVVGQFAIVVGLICLFVSSFSMILLMASLGAPPDAEMPMFFRFAFPIQLFMGLVTLVAGVGLRRLHEWGRRLMLVVIWLWILALTLVTMAMVGEMAGPMLDGASMKSMLIFGGFFLLMVILMFSAYLAVLIAPLRLLASDEAKNACRR
jgi:hypothetical protein